MSKVVIHNGQLVTLGGKALEVDATDTPSITVDSELSSTSVNPVQNKIVTAALAEKITAPTTAAIGQIIKVKSVDTSGKPTEWEAADLTDVGGVKTWEIVADIVVESEDILYYRYEVTNKTECYVMVSLTPPTDSTTTYNGAIGINTVANPWGRDNIKISENIQSIKSTEKSMTYVVSGKIIAGKWIPTLFLKSFNSGASLSTLVPGGGVYLDKDTATNACSFADVETITSIAVGSYAKIFGVGSHIYILAR